MLRPTLSPAPRVRTAQACIADVFKPAAGLKSGPNPQKHPLFPNLLNQYLCITMNTAHPPTVNNKAVVTWLIIGIAMIIVQILIGGITRLTESGLSITEWKPITGMLPPLNQQDWLSEFEKYQSTDQFKYLHQHFSLSDFKFIYFWEWLHRAWARLIGIVFLVGFVYLLAKKKFNRKMILPMILLFALGALQGLIGWIMVKSGLVPEKYYVGHIELTTHFIAALILLVYTLWFALSLMPSFNQKLILPSAKKLLWLITVLVFVQLCYGGFMAGLKAAQSAPTWPSINGHFLPPGLWEQQPPLSNFFNNNLMVHVMHRNMAYLLAFIVIAFFIITQRVQPHPLFRKLRVSFLLLLLIQIVLGIFTVTYAANPNAFTWFGVTHQFVAMLLVMTLTALLFLVRNQPAR